MNKSTKKIYKKKYRTTKRIRNKNSIGGMKTYELDGKFSIDSKNYIKVKIFLEK